MSDQFTSEEARTEIQKAYGNHQADHADDLAGLIDVHDGMLSFLAMYDQGTGDDFELPDDLDQDTKRQISTAHTLLVRAASGIEETAAERLNGGDH